MEREMQGDRHTDMELEKRQRHAYRDTHRQKARRPRTFITFSVHPVPGPPGCEWQGSPWVVGGGGHKMGHCLLRVPSR